MIGVAAVGQHARNIFEQAAAGDVGEALDPALLDERKERADVDSGRLEQDFAERLPALRRQRLSEVPALLLDDPPDEARSRCCERPSWRGRG